MSWLLKLLSYCLGCLHYLCWPSCQGYSWLYYPLGITPKHTDQSICTFKQAQPEVTGSNGMDMDGSPTWMSYKSFCTCAEQPPEPGSPQVNTVPSKNTTAIAWVNKTLNKKTWGTKNWHIQHKHLNDSISDTFGLTSLATQKRLSLYISTGTAHPLTAGSWVQP